MSKARSRIYAAADKEGATEHSHQVAVFAWAADKPELKWMHAIPNGGDRDQITAGKMKAEGVKAGVLDIFLPVTKSLYDDIPPEYYGLYIELKKPTRRTEKLGGLSQAQIDFGTFADKQGYKVRCCYHWRDAVKEICDYVNIPVTFDP